MKAHICSDHTGESFILIVYMLVSDTSRRFSDDGPIPTIPSINTTVERDLTRL